MVKQSTLLSNLQSIAGAQHAREPRDDRRYDVDGLAPKAIAEPGTYEEVAEVLRFANAERLALLPRGAGRQMHIGNIPSRYDIALSLTRLDKIIEHEPADLTVTCQAGSAVGTLHKHLSATEQMVPLSLDPDPADPLTVGGLLGLNMGYMRAAHGSPRDFTIGMKVITGDGRVSSAGGKVVKNVAGYDLCKLYIGSHGTLAVIVEATFKVFPRPQAEEKASFEFESVKDACRFAQDIQARGLSIAEAQLHRPGVMTEAGWDPTSGYVLSLTFTGEPIAVGRSLSESRELATQADAAEFDWQRKPGQKSNFWPAYAEPLSVRAHLLPTRMPRFIEAMETAAHGAFDAAPLSGEVTWVGSHFANKKQWIEYARAVAKRLGGTLEVQFCAPELKRQIDVFGPPPPSFSLMRAIKQQFDPNNILSPGRFVGRL